MAVPDDDYDCFNDVTPTEFPMHRESNAQIRRLVGLMTLVYDDFDENLTKKTLYKTFQFVHDIIYKYHKMLDQGEEFDKTSLTYKFVPEKTLIVDLKECDNKTYPKLQGYVLKVNFKQATLLALIKLKQIIKLKFYEEKFITTPRSIIRLKEHANDMLLRVAISDSMQFKPLDTMKTYHQEHVDLLVGICISPYRDAHLIDGSNCHVAVLYVLLTMSKDLQMRNKRLMEVIHTYYSVGKPLDLAKLHIHSVQIFESVDYCQKMNFEYAKMCDGKKNICGQIEKDDLQSFVNFRKYPILGEVLKSVTESRQRICPFKKLHKKM